MTNENKIKSIHELDPNLIVDFYTLVKCQDYGSTEVTKKALSFIEGLTDDSKIVDLGCGTGGQTLTLGQHAPGTITGIDLFPEFVEIFNKNARDEKLHHRVEGIIGSMDALTYDDETLDLIWSEGAIYNIGFENGLKYWYKFLKPGGYVAVSEVTWVTEERPKEIEEFWIDAYPEIDTLVNKVVIMQKAQRESCCPRLHQQKTPRTGFIS